MHKTMTDKYSLDRLTASLLNIFVFLIIGVRLNTFNWVVSSCVGIILDAMVSPSGQRVQFKRGQGGKFKCSDRSYRRDFKGGSKANLISRGGGDRSDRGNFRGGGILNRKSHRGSDREDRRG